MSMSKKRASREATVNDLIGRVARAICDFRAPGTYDAMAGKPAYDTGGFNQEYYRLMARAAIASLRQPTDEMLAAADSDSGAGIDYAHLARQWSVMIDAALK